MRKIPEDTDAWLRKNFASEIAILNNCRVDLESLPDDSLDKWLMAMAFANGECLANVTSLFGLRGTYGVRDDVTWVFRKLHKKRF